MTRHKDETPLSAVMGPDSHYEGDLAFDGRVRVDGHFTGRIYSEDTLEIGPGGLIEGEADVARAIVSGTVRGKMRVRELLVLQPTGHIEGNLDAGLVELHQGGVISGEVRIVGKELP